MRRQLNPVIWSLMFLLATCAGAIYYAVHSHERNNQTVQARLGGLADHAVSQLQKRFQFYEYGLRAARGSVIGAGDSLSHDGFRRYAESRDFAREFPGAHGFGYIARVPSDRVTAFVAAARKDRRGEFNLHELAPHAGDKFIIKYIEPESRNATAIGLDIASESNRRAAALAAMSSNGATLTAPITLVQASGLTNHSMLFLLPVYSGDQVRAPQTREKALKGWVYAPLVTDEILADFDQAHAHYGFGLTDITDLKNPVSFFSSRLQAAKPAELQRSRAFAMFGRRWRVDIIANPGFVRELSLPDPALGALWIVGSSALLAMVLFVLLTASRRRQRSLAQRARLATIVEDSREAIIGTSLQGVVTEWNRAACDYFGYEVDAAIGQPAVDLIVPGRLIEEHHAMLEKVFGGESVSVSETVRRHRDGSTLYVEISASPIRDGRGQVVGAAETMRDVTARKQAQRKILGMNATLEEQVQQRTSQLQSFSALQRAILANATYAIIATDPEGIITLFNPAAEEMLGYQSSDVLGLHDPGMFHDPIEVVSRAGELEIELGRHVEPAFETFVAKAHDKPDEHEWTWLTRAGDRIPVSLTVSTLRNDKGELLGYLGIAASLLERKQRQAALETNERKLRGLFEMSPLGIALADQSGHLLEFNDAFLALTGYEEHELKAMDYRKLTPPEDREHDRAARMELEKTGRYGPYDAHCVQKGGGSIPVRLNGVALMIDDSPCIWSIAEDTTVQRATEAAMVEAVAAAEAASKAKSDFLANMSHEIRTPMNAILGMLQLLQRTSLDVKQRDYTSKTETAATTLLAILNDILDFSKIEAGRQTLEPHDFEVDKLLREVAVILSANVGAKDVEVVFDVDSRLPKWLIGDSLRLQQVLINLAGNAVKFTHSGEVVLSVKLLALLGNRSTVRFEVRDTGIGIAKEKLASIFEGFSQAEASTTRRFGGSGLGLAICQRLVTLMGGELRVESEWGRGSRFHFTVDLEVPAPSALSPPPVSLQRLHRLRTLVVDDNDSARAMVKEIVRSLDWDCDTAANGEEALARIIAAAESQQVYDAIFMDWTMPGMDGWEASRRIRELSEHGKAPLILMVTMHDRERIAERAAQESPVLDGFLVKPVTGSMLLDAVADARAGRSPVPRPATVAGGTCEAGRLGGMLLLVVEDNPTNQQVARELLEDEGARIDVASGGGEAIRMLAEGDGHYDAVLMDIQMPDMDGYTATRRIRASQGFKTLPIIAMTANVLASDREACLAAGMNDHIGKPFDLNLVVERLLYWTGRARASVKQDATTATVTADNVEAVNADLLNWQPALARFGGKQRAYLAVLERFPDAAAEMQRDMLQALQDGERETVMRQLHTLKGLAAMMGANHLTDLCKSIEKSLHGVDSNWQPRVPSDELKQAIDEATTAARLLRARLDDAAPQAPPEPPSTWNDGDLRELMALLETSNLRAMDVYERLRASLAAAHPEAQARIGKALEQLDMPAALQVCREVLGNSAETSA